MSTATEHACPSTQSGASSGRPVPPRGSVVVRAFSTVPEGGYRHPLLAAAAKLATEHRVRVAAHQVVHDPRADDHALAAAARSIDAGDTACAVLVEQIDSWAATTLTAHRAAAVHTETLGQLVDRIAGVWARSRLLIEQGGRGARPDARVSLRQLGELSTAYDDLVSDLRMGRRRLPDWQTATGPNATV